MSKSIKLKDNNYWDSTSVIHEKQTLDYILKHKQVRLLYSNDEGLVANPSTSFSLPEPCTNFHLLFVIGKKSSEDSKVIAMIFPSTDVTLTNNDLNFYTFNNGWGVTIWYETIYQIIGVCRKK